MTKQKALNRIAKILGISYMTPDQKIAIKDVLDELVQAVIKSNAAR